MPDGCTPAIADTIETSTPKTITTRAAHAVRSLQSLRHAALLLTLARKACGDDADEIDLPLVRQAVTAAKDHMQLAIDEILDCVPDPDDPLFVALGEVEMRMYDPWDAISILVIAMPYRAARNGGTLSICPIAGTLNIVRDRVDQLADELSAVIGAATSTSSQISKRRQAG
jgi:hypothetical protein